jgi:hypothetical protein
MAVLFRTDKAVLYKEEFQDKRNWKSMEPVWYVWKIDDQGFWHWINEEDHSVYHSLDEAKVAFLLESI